MVKLCYKVIWYYVMQGFQSVGKWTPLREDETVAPYCYTTIKRFSLLLKHLLSCIKHIMSPFCAILTSEHITVRWATKKSLVLTIHSTAFNIPLSTLGVNPFHILYAPGKNNNK